MNAVGIQDRAALIRMSGIRAMAENPVLDCIKAEIEVRTRIGTRSQIEAVSKTTLCVHIAPERNIRRIAKRLVIRGRKSETFASWVTRRRRKKTGATVLFLDRNRGERQDGKRHILYTKARVF